MSGQPKEARSFDHVEAWVFDLDNTLYPADCNLFAQINRRMGEFIAQALGLNLDDPTAAAERLVPRERDRHDRRLQCPGPVRGGHVPRPDLRPEQDRQRHRHRVRGLQHVPGHQ